MKNKFVKFLSIIMVLVISLSCVGCQLFELEEQNKNGRIPSYGDISGTVYFDDSGEERPLLTRTEAVKKVERSVVAITMSTDTGSSSGSGVIVGNDNDDDNVFYIITCHHVISSQGTITVYVPDENTRNYGDPDYNSKFKFTGTIDNKIRKNEVISLIGGDQSSDVAVLKLDVTNTEVNKDQIVYANVVPENTEYKMSRGEEVFAIGNPGGELPMTVSAGIISYLDRETVISSVGYMTLMQIDVPINHGNSGGGLFNHYGELIGITNAGSDVLEGIKYAIPYEHTYVNESGFIDVAKELIATYYAWEEQNHGFVAGRWSFGITILTSSTTATVSSVVPNSNADNAGIKAGDKILNISFNKNGVADSLNIETKVNLETAMNVLKKYLVVGDSFTVNIYRSGYSHKITVTLTEQFIFGDTGYRVVDAKQDAAA